MQSEKGLQPEVEINFLDYLIFLLKWKKLILLVTGFCLVCGALAGLLLPRTYRAETRILPPQQNSSGMASMFLSQAGGSVSSLGSLLGANNQTDLYVGMLQSRTVLDNIIKKFDLTKLYHDSTAEDARKSLTKKIRILADPKSNIVIISVEDKAPQRAADIANAFVDELRLLTKDLAITEAGQRRLFLEGQLKDAKETLIKAEDGVKGFQERTGVLHVDEQVKAIIKNIAQLRAEIAAKVVETKVLKTYSKPSNPDVQKAESTLAGMKSELAKLESRSGSGNDPMMPTGRIPSVGTEYVRKLRELKFHETLHDLLLKQYELAKLDESREAVLIQIIDRAVKPEKRYKPKIASMVFIAGLAGSVISILTSIFLEKRELIAHDPENSERIAKLKKYATS